MGGGIEHHMALHEKWNEKVNRQVRRSCVVLSGVFLIVSVVTLINPLCLLMSGRKTEVIITAVNSTWGEGGGSGADAVDYQLIIGSQVVTNRDFLQASIYRPGDRISVLYLPSSPHVATARPLFYYFGGSVLYLFASLSFIAINRLITGNWKPVW